MAAPVYYRYSDPLTQLKAVSTVAWSGEVLIPAWFEGLTFAFNGSGIVLATPSGSGNFGYAAAAPDGSGDVFLLRYQSTLTELASGGAITNYAAPFTANATNIFNGMVYYSGTPYLTDVNGNIFSFQSGQQDLLSVADILTLTNIFGVSGIAQIEAFGSFGVPTRGLAVASGDLWAAAPSVSGIVFCQTASAAVTGLVTTPFATPAAIAANGSGNLVAVAGWGQASISSGFSAIAVDPANGGIFAGITSGASGLTTWTSDASGNWNFQQHISHSSGVASGLAWTPVGNTLFESFPGSGAVDVYTYSLGMLTYDNTLSVAGAAAMAITPNSTNGIVCSPSNHDITSIYVSGGTWAVSGTANVGNPQSVMVLSNTTAVIGCVSGLATATLTGDEWSVGSSSGVGFVPTYLASGVTGLVAAGTSGASGAVFMTGASVSGTFVGGVSGLVAQNGQITILDPTGFLRFFNEFTGAQVGSGVIAPSGTALALAESTLLVAYSGSTNQNLFGVPFSSQIQKTGFVSIYNMATSGWSTANLNVGHTPEAITFDPSGRISVVTLQNELFTITVTGGVFSSGIIQQFTGQPQSTPFGAASLNWINGILWATSCLNESIADIAP